MDIAFTYEMTILQISCIIIILISTCTAWLKWWMLIYVILELHKLRTFIKRFCKLHFFFPLVQPGVVWHMIWIFIISVNRHHRSLSSISCYRCQIFLIIFPRWECFSFSFFFLSVSYFSFLFTLSSIISCKTILIFISNSIITHWTYFISSIILNIARCGLAIIIGPI